jgi:D-alanine-D-alanine ligase
MVQNRIEQIALKVFKLFGCQDYARVDIRLDPDGRAFVLEVNPNPDISPQSGMARAIRVQGMTYTEFIGNLLERALQRKTS